MGKYVLYYSDKCSDTAPFVAAMKENGIEEYEAINITDSMTNLKKFLELRDTLPIFEATKMWGNVGIPFLVTPNHHYIMDINVLNGLTCEITPLD